MRTRTLPLLTALGLAAVPALVATPAAAKNPPTPSFAFTSDRDGDPEIYVRWTDGSTTQVTHNSVADSGAVWSPDGTLLAYSRQYGRGTALYVVRADGTGVRRITTPVTAPDGVPSYDVAPTWSPDGTRIAFMSNRAGGESDIWRVRSDGTQLTRLTRTPTYTGDGNPSWSPDGRWIWFDSDRTGVFNREIYRMRPDGTGVQRMTRTGDVDDGNPDVSPDGRKVVFSSMRATGSQDLFTMNADGSGVRRLGAATAGVDEVFPRWTAGSERVLFWRFASPDEPTDTIWVVDADGSDRHRVTAGRANDWSPDPYPLPRG